MAEQLSLEDVREISLPSAAPSIGFSAEVYEVYDIVGLDICKRQLD